MHQAVLFRENKSQKKAAIRISPQLATSCYRLSLNGHRLLSMVLSRATEALEELEVEGLMESCPSILDNDNYLKWCKDNPIPPIELKIRDLVDVFKCNPDHIYQMCEAATTELVGTVIEHWKEGDWKKCTWSHSCEKIGGVIYVSINPEIRPYLDFTGRDIYTTYTLDDLLDFTSPYQFRLYELFASHISDGLFKICETDLRSFLVIDSGSYVESDKFIERVITPAIKRINQTTDLNIIRKSVRKAVEKNSRVHMFEVKKKVCEKIILSAPTMDSNHEPEHSFINSLQVHDASRNENDIYVCSVDGNRTFEMASNIRDKLITLGLTNEQMVWAAIISEKMPDPTNIYHSNLKNMMDRWQTLGLTSSDIIDLTESALHFATSKGKGLLKSPKLIDIFLTKRLKKLADDEFRYAEQKVSDEIESQKIEKAERIKRNSKAIALTLTNSPEPIEHPTNTNEPTSPAVPQDAVQLEQTPSSVVSSQASEPTKDSAIHDDRCDLASTSHGTGITFGRQHFKEMMRGGF